MKSKRHKKIREIVESKNIETQFQLTHELKNYGFEVTQATVSRDIKELGLLKVATGENTFRYAFASDVVAGSSLDRSKRMLRDNVLKVVQSENIVIVRTLPGVASGVASCIDSFGWLEILGTVAGDDTIFLVIRTREDVEVLVSRIQNLLQ